MLHLIRTNKQNLFKKLLFFFFQSDYVYIIDASTNTLVPLVPAVLAELVTVEIEKIKTHLNRQLLVCSRKCSFIFLSQPKKFYGDQKLELRTYCQVTTNGRDHGNSHLFYETTRY